MANRIGDEAVLAATGRDWAGWLAELDAAGGAKLGHCGMVALLRERYGLNPWWQQMVTVGYEGARGLRAPHERPDGFQISVSRTIAAPVVAVFAAWAEPDGRDRWLPGEPLTVRTQAPCRSLRALCGDGVTTLEVGFFEKGPAKCQVAVQLNRLPDAAAADRVKAEWSAALGRLKAQLEDGNQSG